MKRMWIDYMAPCDVLFFKSLLPDLIGHLGWSIAGTSRKHAETQRLLTQNGIVTRPIGQHDVVEEISQVVSFFDRNVRLALEVPRFDISLSLANIYSIIVSRIRSCPSISIIDNDLIEYERTYMERVAAKIHSRASWIIAPRSYPVDLTISKGASKNHVLTFDGYKEDVYVADFKADTDFLSSIPFDEFVVVRPEALYSTYVHEKTSIVPDLLKLFSTHDVNVLYLPRHRSDMQYMTRDCGASRVWIPSHPMNGLDIVYHSRGVLTGSGTFAREAACMGQVAVSFFPDKLLAVDRSLIEKGRMFHSRNPEEIVEHVLKNMKTRRKLSTEASREAKSRFMKLLLATLSEAGR